MLARFLKRPAIDQPLDGPVRAELTGRVSPLSVVDPSAHVPDDCEIGPFCTIGPDVILGEGCRLVSHVVLTGHTTIGCNNVFFPHCVIGGDPQDKKFRGEPSRLEIGNGNNFREAVTVHLGTSMGGGVTRVGNDNLIMVNCHLGHDCQIGNRNIMGNNVMIAGHVVVGNDVVISGGAAAHHFVTIGDFAFIAGMARLHHDVPPFIKLSDKDKVRAVNIEGLRRAEVSEADIELIEDAARKLLLNREKPLAAALAEVESTVQIHPRVQQMVEFLRRRSLGKHGRYLESLRPKKV